MEMQRSRWQQTWKWAAMSAEYFEEGFEMDFLFWKKSANYWGN